MIWLIYICTATAPNAKYCEPMPDSPAFSSLASCQTAVRRRREDLRCERMRLDVE